MKKQFSTIVLLLIAGIIHAQVGVMPLKDYTDFKQRTLVVVTEEPIDKVMKKMTPEQVEIYKQEIDEYNVLVKWAMDTYYKTGNPVEYKTRTEAEALKMSGAKTHAFLEFTKFFENYDSKAGFEMVQKNRFAKEQTRLNGILSLGSIFSRIDIRFAEDYRILANSQSVDPFYGQYLPNPFPDKAEMAFVFRQIVAALDFREKGITYDKAEKLLREEAKKMQSVTLLVAESDVDPGEDREKLLKAYKYPVEIVSREKITEVILNHSAQHAVVVTVPVMNPQTEAYEFKFLVYNCETGTVVASSVPQEKGGSSVSTGTLSALKAMKKTVSEKKIPAIQKENLGDFSVAAN
jgi:hypothetical protein